MYKIRQKIISAFAALSLLLNSFIPLLSVSPVYAQEEATDSAELILQEAADPSPVPEPSPSPSATPTPTPSLDESLTTPTATQSAIIDTSTTENQSSAVLAPPLWQTNPDGSATTTNPVTLNTTYQAPQNDKVTITFTKLPEGSGTITIKQITASTLNADGLNPITQTAYDITSEMTDGTFEYTLTLPTPTTENVEVKASEDGETFATLGGVTAQTDTLTITGLNHFTIFVVTGTISTSQPFVATSFDESGSSVVINEFVFDPSSGNEWVELYNTSSSDILLDGWRLEDAGPVADLDLLGTISAHGMLVFEHSSGWLNNPSSNGNGDVITLKNSSGTEVSKVTYRREANGTTVNGAPVSSLANINDQDQSIGRTQDGASTWQVFSSTTTTKGYNNSGSITFLNVGSIYPFTTIQNGIDNGIDNVAEGGTVNVVAGEYTETLSIDKSLTLTGAGRENTTIVDYDCSGEPTISIEANDVTIKNFTINNDDCDGSVIGLGYDTGNGYSGVTIQDNKLQNGYYGVELSGGSSDIQVLNNQIFGNGGNGIYSGGDPLSGLTISGNEIGSLDQPNGDSGIYLDQLTGTIDISANTVSYNTYYGVYLGTISEATVTIGGENESDGNTLTNNSYEGLYISSVDNDSTVTIRHNTIESNNTLQDSNTGGIYLGPINQSISTVTIQDNSISNNTGQGIYVNSIQDSTLNMAGNTIDNNTAQGIYLEQASGSEITIGGSTIGESNTITNNDDAGIYLESNVTNTTITGNTIENNGNGDTGIIVYNASGNQAHQNIIAGNGVGVQNNDEDEDVFDATLNFWGSILGPFHEFLNPEGEGNNSVSDRVLFSPFYTVNTDGVLSAPNTLELELEDISSFVANGIFEMPEDWVEGDDFVDLLTILQEIEFNFSVDGGETNVVLPAGVEIFRSEEGEEFAWADLALEDIAESILSGLPSGFVMEEAIQWGIPGVELEFSDAITLSIFVGTDLNGQTLNVVRSTSGSGGWISDGIEPPATCTVAAGVCTFQATKASYYATTRTVASSPSGSTTQALSSAGGGGTPPVCSDAKPGSAPALLSAIGGVNSVILNWSKAKDPLTYYLATYGLAPGLQQYGNPNIGGSGTSSYTVSGLSGGTTYYFKVRAGNGCAPGDFSNELSATPAGRVVSGPAAGFAPGVLGEATFSAETTEGTKKSDVPSQTPEVLGEEQQPQQTPTVVDSLIKNKWPIIVTITLVALFIFWYYRKPS